MTMWLIDKGYYDYDYEKEDKLITVSGTRKSKAEVNNILRNFGLPVGDEDLQSYIIKEEQKNGC